MIVRTNACNQQVLKTDSARIVKNYVNYHLPKAVTDFLKSLQIGASHTLDLTDALPLSQHRVQLSMRIPENSSDVYMVDACCGSIVFTRSS